ncbi:LPS export ABC transporter periplasmic protein LptC [Spirulina subsalsa FACHB-351]|uniref:LPS export ABC transporter periplasmic protein LptC n=1 Tax=Spirulina subsalsa FACHB-351 TaxID=234711 RepID=A0ABT3L3F4_9CYAN|nr:LPS export ABC transporter periplasmic protein LptC [Spirulina subsalsa]MCW6036035.1 LPS export ABC transporter periplasmic protein LptC [Spirulina subsalsa FACHB-351]
MNRHPSWWTRQAVLWGLLLLTACQPSSNSTDAPPTDSPPPTAVEERLILRNVTLENSSDEGEAIWKINAQEAIYTQDQKNAQLKEITGNFFQDGEVIIKMSAEQGEIRLEEDGEKIFLRGKIVATDPRNGLIMRAKELDWFPQEDRLFVREELTGSHPELEMSGKEGVYFTREQRIEVTGGVIATGTNNPFQLRTEKVKWDVEKQLVTSETPLEVDRYDESKKNVTDRVVAERGKFDLNQQLVTLEQNIELNSVDPPVQIASNSAVWNLILRTVLSDQPLRLIHHAEQVTVTANQGFVNLEENYSRLEGGVRARSEKQKSDLFADRVRWDVVTQEVQGQGNVTYKQESDPPLHLTGSSALGKLNEQNVVINSDRQQRVVTTIIPPN